MDLRLAKEIYGNVWMIDPITFIQYNKILEYYQNGGKIEEPELKNNAFGYLTKDSAYTADEIKYEMREIPENTIAIYNFDSVITKNGGMSHYGTKQIASQFEEMENNPNIIGHIFYMESGGGSSNAIKYIRDFSAKDKRTKPLVTFAEDIMASAAMYIASDSDYIIANSKEALIGSIGTMIEFEGHKTMTEDGSGLRHLRVYASQSVNKNAEFEQAINEFNVELIRKKILDPHAAEFIADMEQNRPNITAEQKTGAIYRAEDVVGTLIDEIGDFQKAIDKVEELAGIQSININNPMRENSNHKKEDHMDLSTLKAEHPGLYNEVLESGIAKGVQQERDRAEAWAVFNEVNPEKVKAGIESGKSLSQKDIAELSLQMANKNTIKEIKSENPVPVNTPKEVKSEEELKQEANKKAMDELFKVEG